MRREKPTFRKSRKFLNNIIAITEGTRTQPALMDFLVTVRDQLVRGESIVYLPHQLLQAALTGAQHGTPTVRVCPEIPTRQINTSIQFLAMGRLTTCTLISNGGIVMLRTAARPITKPPVADALMHWALISLLETLRVNMSVLQTALGKIRWIQKHATMAYLVLIRV